MSICDTDKYAIACAKRGQARTHFSHKGASFQVDTKILSGLNGEATGYIEVIQDITQKEIAPSDLRLGARVTCTVKNGKKSRILNGVITGDGTLKCDKMEFPLDRLKEIGVFTEVPRTKCNCPTYGDTVSGVVNLSAIAGETKASMEEVKVSIGHASMLISENNGAALEACNARVDEMSAGAKSV